MDDWVALLCRAHWHCSWSIQDRRLGRRASIKIIEMDKSYFKITKTHKEKTMILHKIAK